MRVGVLTVRRREVETGSVELAEAGMAEEFAVGIEMDIHRAGGIAGQLAFGDGDAVVDGPLLAAHVEEKERDAGELQREIGDEIIEAVQAADGGKGGIALRRIAERDGTTALELRGSPAGDFAHDGGMRDDGEPAVFVLRLAGVVFFDPVWLEDDAVARFDKFSGKLKGSDGGFDLLTQGGSIVIVSLAAEDGDLGRAKRGRGERVHENEALFKGGTFPLQRCGICRISAA